MKEEEFNDLLEGYMFGQLLKQEKARLVDAALDDPARFEEFALGEQVRGEVADAEFRKRLLAVLPRIEVAPSGVSGRQWFAWPWALALLGGATLAIGTLVVRDLRMNSGEARVAGTQPPLTRSVPPDSASSKTQGAIQRKSYTPESGRGEPATKDGLGQQWPATTRAGEAREMDTLFEIEPRREDELRLTLQDGLPFTPADRVAVKYTLHEPAHVYAFVRGPEGAMREVSAQDAGSPEDALTTGTHKISFAARSLADPENGRFRFRLFVNPPQAAPDAADAGERWKLLRASEAIGEVTYHVRQP